MKQKVTTTQKEIAKLLCKVWGLSWPYMDSSNPMALPF